MKHKGILLDLDNTLYDYHSANAAALDAVFPEMSKMTGMDRSQLETLFKLSRAEHYRTLPLLASSHSRILQFQGIFERLGQFDFKNILHIERLYWETFYAAMQVDEEAKAFLEATPLPVCIVTDFTSKIQYEKILHLGLDGCIDAIISSEEAGVEKPHSFIFTAGARKLGLALTDCVMIGDSLDKDIVGAMAAGCDAVYFTDRTAPEVTDRAKRATAGLQGRLLVTKTFSEIAQWEETV